MAPLQSLDPYIQILATLLTDVQTSFSDVITTKVVRDTTQLLCRRAALEGQGFLTKTLPRLGKALDRALSESLPLDATELRFATKPSSKLPILFGELFERVLDSDGRVLQSPCVASIKHLRQLLLIFYKLELPYAPELEQDVVDRFLETEKLISPEHDRLSKVADALDQHGVIALNNLVSGNYTVVRKARRLISRVFQSLDLINVVPRHGPGAVSNGETLWEKYRFSVYNERIQTYYPYDAYFCASVGHVCDSSPSFEGLSSVENMARVILVPKDSRGPRLISCEPVEFQWVQQAVSAALVRCIERSPISRFNVHFTDQQPNQFGALLGSRTGRYATLDLKDASDRVTVGLVRLLFPKHISDVLLACRSLGTVTPDGKIHKLNKYAPMGSSLCFPVMATVIWAILTACATDADARKSILVYGDDVILRADQTAHSITQLESFGLLVNRDKSCLHGFFRESCGMDAYNGTCVTPVRLKRTWSTSPRPDTYSSYIDLSNNLYRHGYFGTSDLIARWVCSVYTDVPTAEMGLPVSALLSVPSNHRMPRSRSNHSLQRREWKVLTVRSRPIRHQMDGWLMLLRFFSEVAPQPPSDRMHTSRCLVTDRAPNWEPPVSTSVWQYTRRDTGLLVSQWRG